MRRVAMVAMAMFVSGAAWAQDVKVDFDHSADFSALKTFSVKIGTSWNNQISEERIMGQLSAEALTAKGWKKVDANPDALVVVHGATDVKRTLNTFYSDMGGYGGYGWHGWGGSMGMGSATTTESQYTVGTVVIDIFNASTKKLVFRGTASDELSNKPEKNVKKANKAFEKMFKKFPPSAEKDKK